MSDLESTMFLLSSNLPVGGDPDALKNKKKAKAEKCKTPKKSDKDKSVPFVDDDEDEVFFGEKSQKELTGKNSK